MVFTNDYRIGVADRSALVLSLVYSGSVAPLLVALLNGTTVLSFNLQQQGIVRLSNWIRQEEITVVCNGAVFRALCPYLDGSHQFPHRAYFELAAVPPIARILKPIVGICDRLNPVQYAEQHRSFRGEPILRRQKQDY